MASPIASFRGANAFCTHPQHLCFPVKEPLGRLLPGSNTESRLPRASFARPKMGLLWMDEIHFAPPEKPGNHDSLVNTNQQWLPMDSKWWSNSSSHISQRKNGSREPSLKVSGAFHVQILRIQTGPSVSRVFRNSGSENENQLLSPQSCLI